MTRERTTSRNKMRPVPPGEVLREQLEELGMSANALAEALHVPTNRITGILNPVIADHGLTSARKLKGRLPRLALL